VPATVAAFQGKRPLTAAGCFSNPSKFRRIPAKNFGFPGIVTQPPKMPLLSVGHVRNQGHIAGLQGWIASGGGEILWVFQKVTGLFPICL
jgi:hypothetical protein